MRFIAHYFLGSSGDSVAANDILDLIKFVRCRIDATRISPGGRCICIADTKSKYNGWIWKMEAGGKVTYNNRSKYAKLFIAALS